MKLKLVLIMVGILMLTLLLAFGRIQTENVALIKEDVRRLDDEITKNGGELAAKSRELSRLKLTVQSIPADILTGFGDPETEFVGFLDFLNGPMMQKVAGVLSIEQTPTFTSNPIPLHETKFNMQFSVLRPEDAEEFFHFLLRQRRYPVQLNTLRLSGSDDAKVNGELSFTFKVPARLKQPLSSLLNVAGKQ